MNKKRFISAVLAVLMVLALIPILSLAVDTSEQKAKLIMGDMSEDGMLNTGDATLMLKYCASMIDFTDSQMLIADANLDERINTADATYILRCVVGLVEVNYYDSTFTLSFASGLASDVNVILPSARELDAGTTFVITDVAIATGYTFTGWQASNNNAIYPAGSEFTMPEQDVVFTALWNGVSPTSEPTQNPSPTPGQTPNVSDSRVEVKYYDTFNETDVTSERILLTEGTNTVSSQNLNLPDTYVLDDSNFSASVTVTNGVAQPASITVNVHPVMSIDNSQFKVITTGTGFEKIRSDLDGYYILGNDIDLGGKIRTPFGWNDTLTSHDDIDFYGIFDGGGHTISNLYIDYATQSESGEFYVNTGIFAVNCGTIRNLNVLTKFYDGETLEFGVFGDNNVGVIAGYNEGNIINCHAIGNVGALYYNDHSYGGGGGIVGTNGGTISKCSFEGGVEGFFSLGGIAGKNFGSITECYFAGGINSALTAEYAYYFSVRYVGGIAGSAQYSTMSNNYVYMTNVIAGDRAIGGLVGWLKGGVLTNSYIANKQLSYVTDYCGDAAGYVVEEPTDSTGLYEYLLDGSDTPNIPSEYSASIWDMNATNCPDMPDLIANRRGEKWADSDE